MNLLEQIVLKVLKEELPNGTPEEAAAICEARIMQAFILIPRSAIKSLFESGLAVNLQYLVNEGKLESSLSRSVPKSDLTYKYHHHDEEN